MSFQSPAYPTSRSARKPLRGASFAMYRDNLRQDKQPLTERSGCEWDDMDMGLCREGTVILCYLSLHVCYHARETLPSWLS
jgi:hypothetical protein